VLCCQIPLNLATKAFSYNLARFWTSFCCKLYNILLSRMRISQNLDFFADSFPIFFSLLLLSFCSPFLFIFYPLSPFYPLETFWPQPFNKPGNRTLINWWLGLFYHQLCTQNWTRFFWYSSARIWSIFKMDTREHRSVLAVLAAYQNNLVTSKMMTSQVVQWFPILTSGKYYSWRERVKIFWVVCINDKWKILQSS